jgi:hypothetical protein
MSTLQVSLMNKALPVAHRSAAAIKVCLKLRAAFACELNERVETFGQFCQVEPVAEVRTCAALLVGNQSSASDSRHEMFSSCSAHKAGW